MRMWMVEPRIMCRKHLLGEHLEIHMFLGTILKRRKIQGYIDNDLLEPHSLVSRHKTLVEEMERRGYKHKSPMDFGQVFSILMALPNELSFHNIYKEKSLIDLLERCPECCKRYNEGLK